MRRRTSWFGALLSGGALVLGVSAASAQTASERTDQTASPEAKIRYEDKVVVRGEKVTVAGTPTANATDDYYLTFDGPVSVPGVSLPAGTYLFRFPSDLTDNVVQVMDPQQSRSYAMFHAVPVVDASRDLFSTDHVMTWRQPDASGAPAAIAAWFPPSKSTGRAFIY
jgi:hypothetical protein